MTEKFYYENLVFEIPEGVYCPAEDSILLAEELEKARIKGKRILEIGTGSGLLAIIAAAKGAIVDACDINPKSVKAAKKNASGCKIKINFFKSDLFRNVKGKYGIIIFNPPYLPENEEDKIAGKDTAYSGGKHGSEIIRKFLGAAGKHLADNGFILMTASSLAKNVGEIVEKNNFSSQTLDSRKLWFEELRLLKMQRTLV